MAAIVEQEAEQTRLLRKISSVAMFFAFLVVAILILLILLDTGEGFGSIRRRASEGCSSVRSVTVEGLRTQSEA